MQNRASFWQRLSMQSMRKHEGSEHACALRRRDFTAVHMVPLNAILPRHAAPAFKGNDCLFEDPRRWNKPPPSSVNISIRWHGRYDALLQMFVYSNCSSGFWPEAAANLAAAGGVSCRDARVAGRAFAIAWGLFELDALLSSGARAL